MNEIEKLIDYIEEEIGQAHHYAKCAVKYKTGDNAKLGELFSTLAKEELNHANMLEEQANRLLNNDKDPSHEWWRMVWNWEHGRFMDRKAEVNTMMATYKE